MMLKTYLYIFIGGAAGGILRVMATRAETMFVIGGMDLTILMVNLIGAFSLGMFLSGTARLRARSPGVQMGVAVGFFGSFTTFSTLSLEAAGLLHTAGLAGLVSYVSASCLAGLTAAALGLRAGAGSGWIRIGRAPNVMGGTGLKTNPVPLRTQKKEEE